LYKNIENRLTIHYIRKDFFAIFVAYFCHLGEPVLKQTHVNHRSCEL